MHGFRLFPVSASSMSHSVDALYMLLTLFSAFFTLLIAGLILFFIIKYRRRDENQMGADIGSHNWLEWTWSIVPFLMTMVFFVWGALLYVRMARPPADAMEIEVIGKQWMWKIQQPSGRKEIDELHIPLGRPIKLVMTSQDVIHSFYIPAFRVKQDVLPGRYSTEWFTPTRLGEYHLFCAEYCGTSHSQMIGHVFVMEPADYAKWAAQVPADNRPQTAGAKLFKQYGCIGCHGQRAPTLAGIYGHVQVMQDGTRVTVDDSYLRESILNSRAKIVAGYPPIMPGYKGQLTEQQVYDLIAYIKSLGKAGPRPANIESYGGSR